MSYRKVVNPIEGKIYYRRTQDEFGDDEYIPGIYKYHSEYDPQYRTNYTYHTIGGITVSKDEIYGIPPEKPATISYRKVVNPTEGKIYYRRSQDEFGDDLFTEGIYKINSEYDQQYRTNYTYHTIGGITVSKDDIYGIPKGGKNNKSRRLSRKTKITSRH
jgi:hypothetical protein